MFRKDFRGWFNVLDPIWGVRAEGSGRVWPICVWSSCPAVPKVCEWRHFYYCTLFALGLWMDKFIHSTKWTPICWVHWLFNHGAQKHMKKVHKQGCVMSLWDHSLLVAPGEFLMQHNTYSQRSCCTVSVFPSVSQINFVNEQFKDTQKEWVLLVCIGASSGVGRLAFGKIGDLIPGLQKIYMQVRMSEGIKQG